MQTVGKFAKKNARQRAQTNGDLAPPPLVAGVLESCRLLELARTRTASGFSRCATLPRRASRETSWALAHFADSTVGRKKTDRGSLLGSFDGGRCVRRSSLPLEFLFFVDLSSNKRRQPRAGRVRGCPGAIVARSCGDLPRSIVSNPKRAFPRPRTPSNTPGAARGKPRSARTFCGFWRAERQSTRRPRATDARARR